VQSYDRWARELSKLEKALRDAAGPNARDPSDDGGRDGGRSEADHEGAEGGGGAKPAGGRFPSGDRGAKRAPTAGKTTSLTPKAVPDPRKALRRELDRWCTW
jgi:hypothetical protein